MQRSVAGDWRQQVGGSDWRWCAGCGAVARDRTSRWQMQGFRNLWVWAKAHSLALEVY